MKNKTVRTRVSEDLKARFDAYCEKNKTTEAELLRRVVTHLVTAGGGSAVPSLQTLPESEAGSMLRQRVELKLTKAEFEAVKRRADAEQKSPNLWLVHLARVALRKQPVPNDKEAALLWESVRELSAIGRNLNQVAKAMNAGLGQAGYYSARDFQDLKAVIDEHKARVATLLDNIENRWTV